LEYDLYSVGDDVAQACRDALATLITSDGGDDALDAGAFLKKIKPRKGRFSQRLASLNDELEPPPYVSAAIEYLAQS
jgi:hypothetical protein